MCKDESTKQVLRNSQKTNPEGRSGWDSKLKVNKNSEDSLHEKDSNFFFFFFSNCKGTPFTLYYREKTSYGSFKNLTIVN